MKNSDSSTSNILEHHVQQELCTTRLPYRQGRKLTAVKVYSVVNESQHLLIFGVPSLNLRSELKALCSRFGTLKTFAQSLDHNELCGQFTECYRVSYERIQSARVAKRQMDVKNFYGGSLHVCYAPEFEELSETRGKLLKRRRDIAFRLQNNHDTMENHIKFTNNSLENEAKPDDYVGNTIKDIHRHNLLQEKIIKDNLYDENEDIFNEKPQKPIKMKIVYTKQYKPCFVQNNLTKCSRSDFENVSCVSVNGSNLPHEIAKKDLTTEKVLDKTDESRKRVYDNIINNESYKDFGKEIIKVVPPKKINKIKFVVKKVK